MYQSNQAKNCVGITFWSIRLVLCRIPCTKRARI